MTYAIIRGKNGRRHEVDFAGRPFVWRSTRVRGPSKPTIREARKLGEPRPERGFFKL
jgi:hypothetical protein